MQPFGCTQDGRPNENGAGKATVYVYRYKQYAGKDIRPSLFYDGNDIARIQSGRMVALELNPGMHIFRSNDQQSRVEL